MEQALALKPEIEIVEEQLQFDLEYDATIKPYYRVSQSRDMVLSPQDLTLMERRILYTLISLVQPDDTFFKTYSIYLKDLSELIGLNDNSFYKRVEETIDGLQGKLAVFEYIDPSLNKRVRHKVNWLHSATYVEGEARVIVRLHEDLAPFLRDFKKYVSYRIQNVLQLRSEYSWRLYELLKSFEFRGNKIYKVKELRNLLNIPDDKYALMKNFRALLDSVQKELKQKTDLSFTYEIAKKVGRNIDSFIFYIYPNTANLHDNTDESTEHDIQMLVSLLIRNGVHNKKAVEIVRTYHPKYVEENIRYVLLLHQGASMRNLAGYIVKAIKDNYADSSFERDSYENLFFNMKLKTVDAYIEESIRADVTKLQEVYDRFNQLALSGSYTTTEGLAMISQERDKASMDLLSMLQRKRKIDKLPPLLLDDVKHHPFLRKIYEQWEQANEALQ